MARITLFAGRFGSGKTEISINYALRLHGRGARMALIDLDIVTPYFRSRDKTEPLVRFGIDVVAPATYGRYSEPVALGGAILGALQNPEQEVVVDVGGDEVGTRVLGTYGPYLEQLDYELLLVANPYRPSTATPPAIGMAIGAIERVSRLQVSGLVSNPNLLDETTVETVAEGHGTVALAAGRLGLPVKLLCVEARLAREPRVRALAADVLSLERHFLPLWDERHEVGIDYDALLGPPRMRAR